jgi:hypothetical protein
MDSILNFIFQYEGKQQEIMLLLHEQICSYPNIQAQLQYRIPFYSRKRRLCYINPKNEGGVELAFVHGNKMAEHLELLRSNGRKQVRGILYSDPAEIELEGLHLYLQDSLELDNLFTKSQQKNEPNA